MLFLFVRKQGYARNIKLTNLQIYPVKGNDTQANTFQKNNCLKNIPSPAKPISVHPPTQYYQRVHHFLEPTKNIEETRRVSPRKNNEAGPLPAMSMSTGQLGVFSNAQAAVTKPLKVGEDFWLVVQVVFWRFTGISKMVISKIGNSKIFQFHP